MKLSVITVTWNSKEYIGEQIRSVQAGCTDISYEQIIVDNGSSDGTVAMITKTFPNISLLENPDNGFGRANNMGFAKASGEYLLFLNPDMRVTPGSLDIFVQWMEEHADVGIASVKLVDEKGNWNREASPRRFPKLWEQLVLLLKLSHFFPHLLDRYQMRDMDPDQEQDVDSVHGACMLMRRDFLKETGWAFDPRYFLWYEDVDICREAKTRGFRVVYTPVISCVDYVGQSFRQKASLWKQTQFTKSMFIYYKKWEPWYKWLLIALVRPIGIGLTWIRDKV